MHKDRLSYGLLLYWLSYSMLRPLLAPYFHAVGLEPHINGFILMLQALPAFALAIPIGHLTSRFGDSRPVIVGASGMVIGGMLLVGPEHLLAFGASQVFVGLGSLAVWISLQSDMISSREPDEPTRVRVTRIARYSVLVALGNVCGPPLGGVLVDHVGYHAAFLGFAVLSLLLVLIYVMRRRPQEHGLPSPPAVPGQSVLAMYGSALRLLKNRSLVGMVTISFCVLYLSDLQGVWSPLYYVEAGLSSTEAGLILAMGPASGFAARYAFPVLMNRYPVGVVAAGLLSVGGSGIAAVVLFTDFAPLLLCATVAGFGIGMAQPFSLELLARSTDRKDHGPAVALRLMANRLSGWLDPLVFGSLLTFTTVSVALVTSAAAIVVLGLVASHVLLRVRQ